MRGAAGETVKDARCTFCCETLLHGHGGVNVGAAGDRPRCTAGLNAIIRTRPASISKRDEIMGLKPVPRLRRSACLLAFPALPRWAKLYRAYRTDFAPGA